MERTSSPRPRISKKALVDLSIGLSITLLVLSLMLIKLSPIEGLEEKLYDYRFKIRGTIKPPENIVIAAIDEKSIERLGRWPWGRDKIARLVTRLAEAGAELIVFDIICCEKEKNDPLLGRAIKKAGNVLLPLAFEFDRPGEKVENEFLVRSCFRSVSNPEGLSRHNPYMAKGILAPVQMLLRETMATGHINMDPDADGTLRWEIMAVEYNGYLYPSLDLQTAAKYLGIPPEKMVLKATEGIYLGKRYIPTDTRHRMLIHYYGPQQTFTYLPVVDILEGKIETSHLKDKIVLIGPTAMGIYDLRVTPFSPVMPGVEKHANLIASILENRFIYPATPFANVMILLLSGLLFSLAVARVKAIGASILAGMLLIILFLFGFYLFSQRGLWIHIAYPSINILAILMSVTAYNYAVEERYAKKIRAMFSSYVAEKIVNELIRNPGMAKLGGERRELTILFSDVRGFTAFSEHHTPEEVVAILNEYLGAMTEIIFKWEGTLDKFMGDAILAFWGAPTTQKNHQELAIRCALNMVKRIQELQEKWKSEGKPLLDAGIGINTGDVLVGNIGAEGKKMDYTVIGDNVNLGSRIESLTRKYNVQILITEFTMDKIAESIRTGRIGHVAAIGLEKVVVKGKEQDVGIYEVRALEHGAETMIVACDEGKVVTLKEK